jgi:asparagine synthase (glutamine-hydrolysing)
MCGIAGAVSISQHNNFSWIKKSARTLLHRGPDNNGFWESDDKNVAFAHQRLTILDLSDKASQPMIDNSNGNVIAFNGEIFNFKKIKIKLQNSGYTFKTKSDTEVLLKSYSMWGMDCVNHLNGQFSFAIYDKGKQQVFIARDRTGEKPFFYFKNGEQFFFASELKALLINKNIPRKIDHQSFYSFLARGYIAGADCIIKDYSKLPAASCLTYDIKNRKLKTWRYWKLPEQKINLNNFERNDLIDKLDYMLDNSIKDQLIADVPVGILLSGGLDSSLITAIASRHRKNIKTFTVSFPGYGVLDEAIHARKISNYFGTEHIELKAEVPSTKLLLKLARQYDEPIIDSSMIPTYLISREVKRYCTVVLGGDGGDELFGGYNHYSRSLITENLFKYIPLHLRKFLSYILNTVQISGFKGDRYISLIGNNFLKEIPLIAKYFDYQERKHLLKKHIKLNPELDTNYITKKEENFSFVENLMRRDFKQFLTEDILVKVDRASMLNSLEMRAPMLDYRLIEFAFGEVPVEMKINLRKKKIILNELGKRILPRDFQFDRKQGFSIPMKDWLSSGPFRNFFWEILTDNNCIFDRDKIDKILLDQDRGKNNGEKIFGLLMFELWKNEYNISF